MLFDVFTEICVSVAPVGALVVIGNSISLKCAILQGSNSEPKSKVAEALGSSAALISVVVRLSSSVVAEVVVDILLRFLAKPPENTKTSVASSSPPYGNQNEEPLSYSEEEFGSS